MAVSGRYQYLTNYVTRLDVNIPKGRIGFTGFYLEKFTHNLRFPVIESWAFGAPSNNSFIQNWHKEFHHALIVVGTEIYLERLQQQPYGEALRKGIQDPKYLLIHITAQKVLRDMETEPLGCIRPRLPHTFTTICCAGNVPSSA